MLRQHSFRIVTVLSIGIIVLYIFQFARQFYSIQIEDYQMFNVIPLWLLALDYILFVLIFCFAKKYVNAERQVPLSTSFKLFLVLLILRAIAVITNNIYFEFYKFSPVAEEGYLSVEIRLFLSFIMPTLSTTLFTILKCFLLYFGIQFLLPNKGNSVKLNILGIMLFAQVLMWLILDTAYQSLANYSVDPILKAEKYIQLFYVSSCFSFLIKLLLFGSIVNIVNPRGFMPRIKKSDLLTVAKGFLVIYIIALIFASLFIDMNEDVNRYYSHKYNLVVNCMSIGILILLSYCFSGKNKIRKALQGLVLVEAILLVLSHNLYQGELIFESMKEGMQLTESYMSALSLYTLASMAFMLLLFIFYVYIAVLLFQERTKDLFSKLLTYAFVLISIFWIINIVLLQTGLIGDNSTISTILRRLPYLLFALVTYQLLSNKYDDKLELY